MLIALVPFRMISETVLWISLVSSALGFIDSSELADQLLEFTRPILKTNGDDAISIPGFKTNISDIFGYNMGTLSCDNGNFTDLTTIQRAGPSIMSRVVLRDDVVLSLHIPTKLTVMKLEFSACEMTILDYPAKIVQPKITVGTNGISIVLSVSGQGNDCTSKVQKAVVNQFTDVSVLTGAEVPNPVVDGFLSGLIQGNQGQISSSIQKTIYITLGKVLNDAALCDLFSAKQYLG